jgi:hypothetical protein
MPPALRSVLCFLVFAGPALALGASACSTKGKSAPPPDFVPADAQEELPVDNGDCVLPGTPSNASGVGGYCTPGGLQCAPAGPDAAIPVCTGDLNAPSGAWFCTILCDASVACGPGAQCITSIRGAACVPAGCAAPLGEVDSGAADEGAPDAATHDAHSDVSLDARDGE